MSIKDEAFAAGVEEKCWKAGPAGACERCRKIVLDIYAARYDDVPPDRVRTVIETDMIRENPSHE